LRILRSRMESHVEWRIHRVHSERQMRIERLNRKRDQDERLRSLEGRWGVRLVEAGGNAHQQTGETSGRRWWCCDVGGHGVDFALRPFNLLGSKSERPTTRHAW